MIGSDWDFDEQSGLLRSGKRYKRDLGPSTEYIHLSSEASESTEAPSVRNPSITPQQRPIIPENLSQSESNPSQSIPVAGQSSPASSNPSSPLDPRWPMFMMTSNYRFLKELGQKIQNSSGFYAKLCGPRRTLRT